jgi:hypothetical protein
MKDVQKEVKLFKELQKLWLCSGLLSIVPNARLYASARLFGEALRKTYVIALNFERWLVVFNKKEKKDGVCWLLKY